jgi:hypothetical protein
MDLTRRCSNPPTTVNLPGQLIASFASRRLTRCSISIRLVAPRRAGPLGEQGHSGIDDPGLDLVAGLTSVGCMLATTSLASASHAFTLPEKVEAWMCPGSPGTPTCDVPSELRTIAGHPIAILKPEYLYVSDSGVVTKEDASDSPCNGYSPSNLNLVRTAALEGCCDRLAGAGRATQSHRTSPNSYNLPTNRSGSHEPGPVVGAHGTRWALRDSNPRPQPCEGCALTS